jgi:hypothetical protein
VEGILFESLTFLSEEVLPPSDMRLKWAIRVDQMERYNKRMNNLIAMQYQSFTAVHLKPILLKGQGVANCYPNPLRRVCGDIDWYFDEKGYDTAIATLKQKKINFNHTAGFSLEYQWSGIPIEHHRRLFDSHNPFNSSYLKSLELQYREKQQVCIFNDQAVKILAPELQILQVNIHILKHLLSFGLGMRQICDAAILYDTYADKLDKKALESMYRRLGILPWIHLLHQILVEQFGLAMDRLPFPYPISTRSNWMLANIWESGNFGFHDTKQGKSFAKSNERTNSSKKIWSNAKRYFKYAPQEVFFFPLVHVYSKYIIK